MSTLSRSLSPPLEEEELEIQTNQILEAKSPLDAIADLSLTAVVAPSDDVDKSNLKHLDHFSHNHPLILYEEEEGNDDVVRRRVGVQEIICSMCRCPISDGPIYSCRMCHCPISDDPIYRCSSSSSSTECELFIIHKSCAELPDEIRIVFHPQHTLFLRKTERRWYNCVICNMPENEGFAYKCIVGDCEFKLHIKCALQYNMQDLQDHDHSLILFKQTLFTCDACGFEKETKCVSYVCTTCQLQVHQDCFNWYFPFPLTVKQIRHPHELSLTFLSHSSCYCFLDYDNDTCMICDRGMNGVLCFYYCADCRFIAHAKCALSRDLRDEYDDDEEVFKELENENQDLNLTTTTLAPGLIETTKEMSHSRVGGGDGEDQKATDELRRHFSHPQHCLILSNDPKLNEFCDGCTMPISVPYYTCADHECDFLLHKQCFELPHKIQHLFHNHQLTLQAKAVDFRVKNPIGIFTCRLCRVMCNGFTYTCYKCEFFIDVGCSLLRDPLIHDGHECALSLVDRDQSKCNACGLITYFNFKCRKCDFKIDSRCALLPSTISHDCPKPEWGIRPYNLTFHSVDDGSGEYYCDICEERRIPNYWFYYCKNCDYSGHPQCLLAKHRIKFGRTYLSKCHPHSLTLVKEAKDKGMGHPPCATCGDRCKDVAVLFCTECDIYIHYKKKCCDSG